MVIGIHAQADLMGQRTGVEEYLYRLLEQFAFLPQAVQHKIILYRKDSRALDLNKSGFFVEKHLSWPFPFWTQVRLAMECALAKPDVLFVPAQIPPLFTSVKTVIVVHGLEFMRYPSKYPRFQRKYLERGTQAACKKAAHIIVVSHATKEDLMQYYAIPEKNITVIHHGVSTPPESYARSGDLPSILKSTPYFLFIGRIETKKNIDGLIKAFDLFKQQTHGPQQLVLAGKKGFGYDAIARVAHRAKHKKDIIFGGYIDEPKKWSLLKNAQAFVFPSWWEGFGMPILEAQSVGTPVITSNVASMPEVAGQGALVVNPASLNDICSAMVRIAYDESLQKKMITFGLANVQRFSWKRCAQETLRVLTAV